MARFVKGDIVIIPFPFSDLSGSKRRPALVLADLPGDDILLCQITSQSTKDIHAVALPLTDFDSGSLPLDSFVRSTRIFTADKSLILRKAGTVKTKITDEVVKKVVNLLTIM